MSLTTTVGTADADAFVSVSDCTTYCTDQGLTGWTDAARSPAEDDEAAIRRATTWLSTAFRYKGSRTNGRGQSLAFPRINLTDEEGEDIASDEIPIEIVQATCIAAAYERANPGGLSPSVTMTDRVKREKIGAIEVEYATTSQDPGAARPVLLQVQDLIGGLLATGSSNGLVGAAVRW